MTYKNDRRYFFKNISFLRERQPGPGREDIKVDPKLEKPHKNKIMEELEVYGSLRYEKIILEEPEISQRVLKTQIKNI